MFKNKKTILIIITSTIVLLVAFGFFEIFRGSLVIKSEYKASHYYIDDKEVSLDPVKRLFPGEHVLKVVAEDLEDGYFDFKISVFQKTEVEISELEQQYADLDENIKPELQERLNIIRRTPLDESFGEISFNYDTNQFIVILTSSHTKEEALSWFSNNGTEEVINNVIWK